MQYERRLDQQQAVSQSQAMQLQRQHRNSQYQFQQRYSERLQQQRLTLRSRNWDYNNDPYYYTAPSYRYSRGGSWYQVNNYGADALRQAINAGYGEGFAAGQADRQDRWRYDYRNSYAYQDASYGYEGSYVSYDEYSYYFRKGFKRGYEDGYYTRYRYGRYDNGRYSVKDSVLSIVLNLESLH